MNFQLIPFLSSEHPELLTIKVTLVGTMLTWQREQMEHKWANQMGANVIISHKKLWNTGLDGFQ